MAITTVLFDLDGTLLPMDQEHFVKMYFGLLAKTLAKEDPEALFKGIWTGTRAMMTNDGSKTNEDAFWATSTASAGSGWTTGASGATAAVWRAGASTNAAKRASSCWMPPMAGWKAGSFPLHPGNSTKSGWIFPTAPPSLSYAGRWKRLPGRSPLRAW